MTTPSTSDTLPADNTTLEHTARLIADLQAQDETIRERISELKASIADTWPAGTYQAGDLTVSVREGAARIDPDAFRDAYPAGEYPDLYDIKPSLARARRKLGDDAIAPLTRRDRPTVSVR